MRRFIRRIAPAAGEFVFRSHVEENIYIGLHRFGRRDPLNVLICLDAMSKLVQANTIPIFLKLSPKLSQKCLGSCGDSLRRG